MSYRLYPSGNDVLPRPRQRASHVARLVLAAFVVLCGFAAFGAILAVQVTK